VGDVRDWISLFAAIGHLSLAVTAFFAGRRSPLGRPLAALCFALFGWNFATLGHHVLGGDAFVALDSAFTALSPPLVLEVVVRFVGRARARRERAARGVAWALFGGLAVASLASLRSRDALAWLDAPSWAGVFLAGWLPSLAFELVLLVRHLARASDPAEKARARIVLAALAIGAASSTSDVARSLGVPSPYLGAIGTLCSTALLTTLAVRHELFERNVSRRTALYVIAMIGAFVTLYLVAFRAFAENAAAQAFAAVVVTLLVAAAARELASALAESRERVQRLTVLGRFSAQMAHDIKGPLAALLGAVEVVEGLGDDDAARASREELLGLARDQAKRIAAIVDRYDRMGRVEPQKTRVRVDEVVRAVARAKGIPDGALTLGVGEGECEADRDLLESALENVVRNAVESGGGGGARGAVLVRIETRRAGGAIVVRVIDDGAGMDPRQAERAFEDFFTTKPAGSGLGLPFVRRVMLAHAGDVTLASERGKGTTVELRLPG
jgi:signal transduction histidine kinase